MSVDEDRQSMTPQTLVPPAQHQLPTPPEETLHSANCGMIIHRVGQSRFEFRSEGRAFALALQKHVNRATHPRSTTLVYQEILGREARLHWLVHLRAPNDYIDFLHMSDHDRDVRQVMKADMLPRSGGGNWEKIFQEGSFQEQVLVPQHGIANDGQKYADRHGLFVPPARFQSSVAETDIVHSANAEIIIKRSAQIKFAFREEGRVFAHEYADHINRRLAGRVSALLYEETWGRQDRVHWLIHLKSAAGLSELLRLAETDEAYRALLAKQYLPVGNGSGTWAAMFVDGSIDDTLMAPCHDHLAVGWP